MLHIENLTVHVQSGPSALSRAFIDALLRGPVPNESGEPSVAEPTATALFPAIGQPMPGHAGVYSGLSRGLDGAPDGHLVLLDALPGKDLTWADAIKWAESLGDGSRLPTRFESALLYANLQDKIKTGDWYWTGTQYSGYSAWFQYFNSGTQDDVNKSSERRARAVRRLDI